MGCGIMPSRQKEGQNPRDHRMDFHLRSQSFGQFSKWGNHFIAVGDLLDIHNYPGPKMYLFDGSRANVLGEYGGIGLAIENHLWQPDRNWGYVQYKTSKQATDQYVKYAEELFEMIQSGFSAAIYTQTTVVEIEVNGLLTYDRKIIKLEVERIKKINQRISNALSQ